MPIKAKPFDEARFKARSDADVLNVPIWIPGKPFRIHPDRERMWSDVYLSRAGDQWWLVDAEVVDLSGRRQAVALRPVATGDYTDHVGTVKIGPRDTLRVEVVVTADGRRQRFDFQRSF